MYSRFVLVCFALLSLAAHAAPVPEAKAPLRPLFDGRTLDGWEGDTSIWRVADGALTGGSLTETVRQNEFLATTASYTNFVVRMKIKLTGSSGFINSGFQIRSTRVANSSEMSGYQCDFGDPNWWGAIYDESRRDKVLSPADMTALGPVIKRNDWNDYVIRADGPRITTWINGAQGTDYYEPDAKIPLHGRMGIQVHGGGKALVQVKEITIEELPPRVAFIGAPEPGKAAKASPLSPEEQRASFSLPPGFTMELVAAEEPDPNLGKFITVDWDQRGRMWSMTALDYPVDGNENPAQAKALYESPGKDKVLVYEKPFGPGPHKASVFAEGLAIPLGILPFRNGAYVQHGPEIVFLSDTNADGRADRREVTLSGFGVQDSHLFPHQFTRAPGNWLWMAQGAFNSGKVKTSSGGEVQFDATRMSRFRSDGSQFEITSQGPCNIWGLVMGAEGEVWIQEANDYGFPVMPFDEFANYPGCSDRLFKSYGPEFPGIADMRLGGTGLSGLALSDKEGAWPEPYADVMYVANPITQRINAIKIHRDGPRYQYQRLPDLVSSSDEMFRPVSIQTGPDGCLYIVDWYNKIISHNEVPRTHPDRDKIRGRIWRVKHERQTPFPVNDLTQLAPEELLKKLGGLSLRQSHLAWQAIIDRDLKELIPALKKQVLGGINAAQRIASLWALEGLRAVDEATVKSLLTESNRNVRREAVRAAGEAKLPNLVSNLRSLVNDTDPEVRAEVIRVAGRLVSAPWSASPHKVTDPSSDAIALLVTAAREPLSGPLAPATRDGKMIKVREAYDRDFERYLIRLFLEQQPEAVARFLDSEQGRALPTENRLLAVLSLKPADSVGRLAALLPTLQRAPDREEVLRLAEFPDQPGVLKALEAGLRNKATQSGIAEALLASQARLDATKLRPLLTETARELFSVGAGSRSLALRLAGAFRLAALENDIDAALHAPRDAWSNADLVLALKAQRELGASRLDGILAHLKNKSPEVADQALLALASSKHEQAPMALFANVWTDLTPPRRRLALRELAGSKQGAREVITRVVAGDIDRAALDGAVLDRLQAVTEGNNDLANSLKEIAGFFRPVLLLDGSDNAFTQTEITLDGAFTVETWVRLDPGIDNKDGILGVPGALDMNFYDGRFRVWVGNNVNDAIVARRTITAGHWTHVAVTRDAEERFRIYIDGTLDADASKVVKQKFERVRIGWTAPNGGTAGALTEFRIWTRARPADEIVSSLDRSFDNNNKPADLVFSASGQGPWGKLNTGATVGKTSDFAPVLTAAEAAELDKTFDKYRQLATASGDAARGKTVAAACTACHLIRAEGGKVGPDLSGAGAMGVEALLRNIISPNAAMEAGYRTYRVELNDGDIVDGLFVSEDATAVVVRIPNANDRRIARNEIRHAGFIRRSLMPEGLLEGMAPQDISDLFAYLKTLK